VSLKSKFKMLIIALFIPLFGAGISEAALTVNNEALEALDYQNDVIKSLMLHINFYEVGISFISPSPLTGYSVIRGSKSDSRYSKIFEDVNAKNKQARRQKEPEMWEDMIKSSEQKTINYFVSTLTKTGREIWPGWPDVPIPGDRSGKRFSIAPSELKFIIPSFSGVIIGSSSRFDKSMQDYLIEAKAFYPIITFAVPIPKQIEQNKYRETIYANIMGNVPGSNIKDGEIIVTIFPGIDSLNDLVSISREIMAGEPQGQE